VRTDFDFRRTVTTLTFCGAGIPLTGLLAWGVYLVQSHADLVYKLTVGTIILLGIVLIGLSFTVAMRQISGSILGSSFSASGGDDDPAPVAQVTTTTTTAVTPPATET
jgi:hypothetical protein